MNTAAVIAFLSDELARHGAEIISKSDLASLGIIERHLDAGLSDIDEARAIAWVASMIPRADRKDFRTAFGKTAADHLERLVPNPNAGSSDRRMAWGSATERGSADVRRIAVALLASEATKITDADDHRDLVGILDIAIEHASDPGIQTALTAIRDGLPAMPVQAASPVKHSLSTVITLSIDVVGSTEAKRRLRDLAVDDARRTQLYSDFYAGFLRAEERFYANLFEPSIHGYGPPLDWRNLFVVKGIGDELWLTYEVIGRDPDEQTARIRQAAVRMMTAGLELNTRRVSCGGTAKDLGPTFDPFAEEAQAFDRMELPFKVSMDLIEDAIEISGQRLDYFKGKAKALLAAGPQRQSRAPFGAEHAEMLRRLNAGHFELAGGHRLREAFRTDYIGPDIDRFFRITKFALPGVVMVGANLMERLQFHPEKTVNETIDYGCLTYPPRPTPPYNVVRTHDSLLRSRHPIPADELKGVGSAYAVYHIIGVPNLRGILHEKASNPFFGPTVKEFPDDMADLIAPARFP